MGPDSPQFPETLGDFRRLDAADPLCAFLQEPYERVRGKTDAMAAYIGRDARGALNILLHSPDTLQEPGDPSHRRYLARKNAPWSYQEMLTPEVLSSLATGESLPEHFRDSLWFDGVAEGDSLRLFNHVAKSDIDVPKDLWPILLLWLRDEANHRDGFRALYEAIYGKDMQREHEDKQQLSDFSALEDILHDPFALLVSLMYDESATIIGYRKYLPMYRAIGEPAELFVKRVNADEGWHFQKFLQLAARDHADRTGDIDAVIDRIAKADATEYRRTFIFDRGEDVTGAKRFGTMEQEIARQLVKRKFLQQVAENQHAETEVH